MAYKIEFYKTKSGRTPVTDFIKELPDKHAAKILRDIRLLKELGSDLHHPFVDSIKGDKYSGLMELSTKQGTNIFRTFYFTIKKDKETQQEAAVLLHAIQKKTQKHHSGSLIRL